MKSTSNTNLANKLRKLLFQGTTKDTLIIWSLGFVLIFTILILFYFNKQKTNKNNAKRQSKLYKEHQEYQQANYTVNNENTNSTYLNKCLKWLYFSSDKTNRINNLLTDSLNNFYNSSVSTSFCEALIMFIKLKFSLYHPKS
jgi:hypothetical protein